jgi:hypothetical protein
VRRLLVTLSLFFASSIACTLGSSTSQPTRIAAVPTATTIINIATSIPSISPTITQVINTAAPSCTPRSDWPLYTVASGDTLGSLAERTSSTVQILVTANCLTNANLLSVGQQIRVPSIPAPLPTPTSNQCAGNVSWFFTFTAGAIDRLCPNPVQNRNAVGEDFEGGRMLWYAALPGESDQRATIYIIYNDGDWETIPDIWAEGQMVSDPNVVPPAGRFQPVRGFGKVWRENTAIRQRLGWAYEPEATFAGRMQTVIVPNPRPAGYVEHWYLDHGKAGIVLRLYSIDMAPNKWELAGKY